jgi:cell wall-associated NlpC family hydrolase
MHVKILRDAWQQAEQGMPVSIGQSMPGDLAFFNNDEGRVVHVGILLAGNTIIHAAGKVRIDHFGEEGIINADTGEKSHSLCGIRRYS